METALSPAVGEAANKTQSRLITIFVVAHIAAVVLMWFAAERVAQAHVDRVSDHSFKLSLFPVPDGTAKHR